MIWLRKAIYCLRVVRKKDPFYIFLEPGFFEGSSPRSTAERYSDATILWKSKKFNRVVHKNCLHKKFLLRVKGLTMRTPALFMFFLPTDATLKFICSRIRTSTLAHGEALNNDASLKKLSENQCSLGTSHNENNNYKWASENTPSQLYQCMYFTEFPSRSSSRQDDYHYTPISTKLHYICIAKTNAI